MVNNIIGKTIFQSRLIISQDFEMKFVTVFFSLFKKQFIKYLKNMWKRFGNNVAFKTKHWAIQKTKWIGL